VTARAGVNIALVKYWGKRDAALNLPATGSLSLTLDGLGSVTRVRFLSEGSEFGGPDRVLFDGRPADDNTATRITRFLDLVRNRAGLSCPAEIVTSNSVPTASGLASSASGFAALALAASRSAGLDLPPEELSALARRGSGSAARSIFGGFVEMAAGTRRDGTDAFARPLLPPDAWDVRIVVAVTNTGPKKLGSTQAMERTARSSPYYPAWIESVGHDLAEARAAIAERDLSRLGGIVERSAFRMHACALAAEPVILYWNPGTIAAIDAISELRASGVSAFVTIDAGPHVKVLCAAADVGAVEGAFAAVPGVQHTLVAAPGPGATIIEEQDG
jgi:diphosphomevalonate decarboxylase